MERGYPLSIGLEDGTKLGPQVLSKRPWSKQLIQSRCRIRYKSIDVHDNFLMNFDIYQERKDLTFITSCAGVPSEKLIHGFV